MKHHTIANVIRSWLLPALGIGAFPLLAMCQLSRVPTDECSNPGAVLLDSVTVSAGGPYNTKAGVSITLHGSYTVAHQTEDMSQLKTIGQALNQYLQANGTYPPAALLNEYGQPTVSWRVLILPYLGEEALYKKFHLKKSWNDPANLCLLEQMPAVYRKQGAPANTTETGSWP
jgi:hypothetical protein